MCGAAKNQAESVFSSAYGDDPKRPRVEAGEMRVPSFAPFNMEPPIAKLTDEFLTPNDVFGSGSAQSTKSTSPHLLYLVNGSFTHFHTHTSTFTFGFLS